MKKPTLSFILLTILLVCSGVSSHVDVVSSDHHLRSRSFKSSQINDPGGYANEGVDTSSAESSKPSNRQNLFEDVEDLEQGFTGAAKKGSKSSKRHSNKSLSVSELGDPLNQGHDSTLSTQETVDASTLTPPSNSSIKSTAPPTSTKEANISTSHFSLTETSTNFTEANQTAPVLPNERKYDSNQFAATVNATKYSPIKLNKGKRYNVGSVITYILASMALVMAIVGLFAARRLWIETQVEMSKPRHELLQDMYRQMLIEEHLSRSNSRVGPHHAYGSDSSSDIDKVASNIEKISSINQHLSLRSDLTDRTVSTIKSSEISDTSPRNTIDPTYSSQNIYARNPQTWPPPPPPRRGSFHTFPPPAPRSKRIGSERALPKIQSDLHRTLCTLVSNCDASEKVDEVVETRNNPLNNRQVPLVLQGVMGRHVTVHPHSPIAAFTAHSREYGAQYWVNHNTVTINEPENRFVPPPYQSSPIHMTRQRSDSESSHSFMFIDQCDEDIQSIKIRVRRVSSGSIEGLTGVNNIDEYLLSCHQQATNDNSSISNHNINATVPLRSRCSSESDLAKLQGEVERKKARRASYVPPPPSRKPQQGMNVSDEKAVLATYPRPISSSDSDDAHTLNSFDTEDLYALSSMNSISSGSCSEDQSSFDNTIDQFQSLPREASTVNLKTSTLYRIFPPPPPPRREKQKMMHAQMRDLAAVHQTIVPSPPPRKVRR